MRRHSYQVSPKGTHKPVPANQSILGADVSMIETENNLHGNPFPRANQEEETGKAEQAEDVDITQNKDSFESQDKHRELEDFNLAIIKDIEEALSCKNLGEAKRLCRWCFWFNLFSDAHKRETMKLMAEHLREEEIAGLYKEPTLADEPFIEFAFISVLEHEDWPRCVVSRMYEKLSPLLGEESKKKIVRSMQKRKSFGPDVISSHFWGLVPTKQSSTEGGLPEGNKLVHSETTYLASQKTGTGSLPLNPCQTRPPKARDGSAPPASTSDTKQKKEVRKSSPKGGEAVGDCGSGESGKRRHDPTKTNETATDLSPRRLPPLKQQIQGEDQLTVSETKGQAHGIQKASNWDIEMIVKRCEENRPEVVLATENVMKTEVEAMLRYKGRPCSVVEIAGALSMSKKVKDSHADQTGPRPKGLLAFCAANLQDKLDGMKRRYELTYALDKVKQGTGAATTMVASWDHFKEILSVAINLQGNPQKQLEEMLQFQLLLQHQPQHRHQHQTTE